LLILISLVGILLNSYQVIHAFQPKRPIAMAQFNDNPVLQYLEKIQEEGKTPTAAAIGAIFAIGNIVVFAAAIQMLRLKAWGFAVGGSIFSMVNLANCCCVVGLPVGLWALLVLSNTEVRRAFE
jgi:hypothetical protein